MEEITARPPIKRKGVVADIRFSDEGVVGNILHFDDDKSELIRSLGNTYISTLRRGNNGEIEIMLYFAGDFFHTCPDSKYCMKKSKAYQELDKLLTGAGL